GFDFAEKRVCYAEKLPGCIACKNFGAVERYFGLMHNIVDKFVGRTKYLFVNEQSRLDPLSFSSSSFTLCLKKLGSNGREPRRRRTVGDFVTAGRGMLVKQVLEKEVELVGGELWGSEEFGLKIGFKDSEVDSREFPGLNIHRRAREAGETELRHDAVVV
uniref:hypothetical protein n=4 Tax=Thiolapillus sp. TaxID=2017437 RepID=UPI0025D0CE74